MAQMHLLDHGALHAATNFIELENMKAAGRAQWLGNIARMHFGNEIGDDRGQLCRWPPAERAAFDVSGAVRISDRKLREILASLRLGVRFFGALFATCE